MQQPLNEVEEMLETMVQDGSLDPDSYYKCMAELASDHAVKHLDIEKALVVLNRLPPAYFAATMVGQMAIDSFFAQAMTELVYRLTQLGTSGNVQHCNMLPAEA